MKERKYFFFFLIAGSNPDKIKRKSKALMWEFVWKVLGTATKSVWQKPRAKGGSRVQGQKGACGIGLRIF